VNAVKLLSTVFTDTLLHLPDNDSAKSDLSCQCYKGCFDTKCLAKLLSNVHITNTSLQLCLWRFTNTFMYVICCYQLLSQYLTNTKYMLPPPTMGRLCDRSVVLSVIVNKITDECGNGCKPNMAGMGKG